MASARPGAWTECPVGRCFLAAVWLLVLCVGCGRRNVYVVPPPPEVIVGVAQQRPITLYHEYTGTTQASEQVQIRARVQGYLDRITFTEGATVSEGQLLFVIDQRPYRAQLDQAQANLESRKAAAVQQQSVYRRTLALLPSKATTQEQADIDRGNWLVAQAAVMQAEALVRQAQLNLDYTEIRAPIEGRIGRRLVDVGNLVSSDTTLLATIVRYDPMYAYFNASEANYLDYLKRRREKAQAKPEKTPKDSTTGNANASEQRTPVEMGLANEQGYPHHGYIDFAEPTIDPNTGTLLIRGVFENPQPYHLAPGLFVRLRVPIGQQPNALLVPEEALSTDQAGQFLLVVNSQNVVQHRSVAVGHREGAMRVIEEGLKPGERFIVEGLLRAREGALVKPIQANRPTPANRPPSEDSP